MNSTKPVFFLFMFLLYAFCMTTTESKCHRDQDCKNVKLPCPGPLACLYGGCVCTYQLDKPLDIPNTQIKYAHSGEKVINLHDSSF
ncbi:hypothetical protein N665_0004s0013 [Sinapis alba]|nr:hypothetical protein N665_0004s0013 [Sinapis alba]